MGRRSSSRSIAAIYQAFLRDRTWRQAELAERVGISVKALRERLGELEELGMPLVQEREHPNVFWSVRPEWYPGGVALTQEDVVDLVQELWSLPRSASREALLKRLLGTVAPTDRGVLERAQGAVITPAHSSEEEAFLPRVQQSLLERAPLRIWYVSAYSGRGKGRSVSVQRVAPGPPARFVGWCHEDNRLKWFRVDNIVRADIEGGREFVDVGESVDAFVAASMDGFREDEPVTEHIFFVRDPEARWVAKNLIAPMVPEDAAGGIRVSAKTAGALRVARFVVALGEAARAETLALRCAVEEIALGALGSVRGRAAAVGGPLAAKEAGELNRDAVGVIRSEG